MLADNSTRGNRHIARAYVKVLQENDYPIVRTIRGLKAVMFTRFLLVLYLTRINIELTQLEEHNDL